MRLSTPSPGKCDTSGRPRAPSELVCASTSTSAICKSGWTPKIYGSTGEGATNNIAEYNAALDALCAVYGRGYKGAVRLHGDSELVVFQYNRKYRCKAAALQELLAHLRTAVTYFKSVEVVWVPRERNAIADEQSRLAYEAAREAGGVQT